MESVSDADLSGVSGQSGIDLSLVNTANTAAITTTYLDTVDGSSSNSTASTAVLLGFAMNGIGTGGVSKGPGTISTEGAYSMMTSLDLGSTTGTAPVSTLGLGFFWGENYGSTFAADTTNTAINPLRMQVSQIQLENNAGTQTPTTPETYGSIAFDSSGSLRFGNVNGLFSNTPEMASGDPRVLRLTLGSPQFGVSSPTASYGELYYRQAALPASYGSTTSETSSELVFNHMYLDTGFEPGIGGVISTCLAGAAAVSTVRCGGSTLFSAVGGYPAPTSGVNSWFNGFNANHNGGIYIGTSALDFNFSYDVSYRGCGTGAAACTGIFTNNNISPLGHLSWSGGFNYAELLVGAGGIWTNTAANYNPDDPGDTTTGDCSTTATTACAGDTRNNGVNIAFHGNFVTGTGSSAFAWTVGDAAGTGSAGARDVSFTNWVAIPGAIWELSAPNITIGSLNAGQGPGGLCWGANFYGSGTVGSACGSVKWVDGDTAGDLSNFYNLSPANTALGLVVRDLSLQSYSQTVNILDDKTNSGTFTPVSYSWGLIYTLGQFDQNMYIYPGNRASYGTYAGETAGSGLTMDWLLMSQSFGNYPVFNSLGNSSTTNALLGNTNFMIADTGYVDSTTACTANEVAGACAFGIGMVQANFLLGAHLMSLNLTQAGLELKSNDVRFELEGLMAGGPVPNLEYQYLQKLYYLDMNFEATQFDMVLSAATTSNGYPYLGFSNRLTLGDTVLASGSTIGVPEASVGANGCQGLNPTSGVDCNYISLGEPSSPGTDFRVADISGDLNVINGVLGLFSAADSVDSPDGKPKLVLAATVQIGTTIGSGTTSPLTGIVKFGGSTLGYVAIPSGQLYSYVALKPQ